MIDGQDQYDKYTQSLADSTTVHAAITSIQSTPGMAYDTKSDHNRRGHIAVNVWMGRPALEGLN